jgi:hypothetical protein
MKREQPEPASPLPEAASRQKSKRPRTKPGGDSQQASAATSVAASSGSSRVAATAALAAIGGGDAPAGEAAIAAPAAAALVPPPRPGKPRASGSHPRRPQPRPPKKEQRQRKEAAAAAEHRREEDEEEDEEGDEDEPLRVNNYRPWTAAVSCLCDAQPRGPSVSDFRSIGLLAGRPSPPRQPGSLHPPSAAAINPHRPPQEDDALKREVARAGARNWTHVAKGLEGRNGKSCRLRCARRASLQPGSAATARNTQNEPFAVVPMHTHPLHAHAPCAGGSTSWRPI